MNGLGELFTDGRVAVVHGVGNPNPDRSHFRSLEVWHTADPDGPAGEVGWLGRLSDQIAIAFDLVGCTPPSFFSRFSKPGSVSVSWCRKGNGNGMPSTLTWPLMA